MPLARWFTAIWFVATLVGLGLPGETLPDVSSNHLDKVAHVGVFLVGTALALIGWPAHRGRVLLLMLLFAPLAEVWQAVLPTGREADLLDALANAAGVALGWALVRVAYRDRRVVRA